MTTRPVEIEVFCAMGADLGRRVVELADDEASICLAKGIALDLAPSSDFDADDGWIIKLEMRVKPGGVPADPKALAHSIATVLVGAVRCLLPEQAE